MLYNITKKIVKAPLHAVGLDIVRRSKPDEESHQENNEPPPLLDDPLEALCREQGGEPAAFRCPLKHTVTRNALSYSPDGWHPFVATLRECAVGTNTEYKDSVLRQFYDTHRPKHAAEAVAGFDQFPSAYIKYPAHVYRLAPWRALSVEKIDWVVRSWTNKDRTEHSNMEREWSLDYDGYPYHGPVSRVAGVLEYQRLISVYRSLKSDGYNRSYGHTNFILLMRGNEYRILNVGQGNHRTAAMAALGHKTVPARFFRNHVINIDMAQYWPQVRNGLWTEDEAEAYFHHLFDFDSGAWARERGLLSEE